MNRTEVINKSLRCFGLGLAGLVPVLGIPAGVLAMVIFRQVTMQKEEGWNPAQRYLLWGFCLGAVGLLISLLLSLLLAVVTLNALLNQGSQN